MKIQAIRRIHLPTPVPVYDLSAGEHQNFKLADGPYVHNSKDVSDALAGVVYGLTMRKETWLNAGIGLGEIPDEVRQTFQKDKLKTASAEA